MNSNDRVKRYRERQKALGSVTLPVVLPVTKDAPLHEKALQNESVTLYRYIDGRRDNLDKVPEGFKVLSDGQVWKPSLVIKPVVIDDPIRKERAERYWTWYGCNIKDGRMLGAS